MLFRSPSGVSTVSHASAPSAISQFSPVVQTAYPPASTATPAGGGNAAKTALVGVAIGIGVFALVAVGGGGLYLMRSRGAAAGPVQTMSSAPADPVPAQSEPEVLVELLTPKTGVTLLVDGVVQPVGQLSFARPKPGTTRKLTARADGFKDAELSFDDKTEKVRVELAPDTAESDERPATEPKPAEQKPAEQKPGSDTKPLGGSPAPKPKGPTKVDIPDNPF